MLLAGQTVLVSAHGNSLRALLMEIDDVSEDEISGVNIPNGTPLVYNLVIAPATANLTVLDQPGASPPLRGVYLTMGGGADDDDSSSSSGKKKKKTKKKDKKASYRGTNSPVPSSRSSSSTTTTSKKKGQSNKAETEKKSRFGRKKTSKKGEVLGSKF